MNLTDAVESVPLKTDAHGTIRVGGTRVTLDTVVYEFKQGLTVEEIVYQFDSLDLADMYAVIAYYLRHQDEVEAYLHEQEQLAAEVREQIEQRSPSQGLRDRLMARCQTRLEAANSSEPL